MSFLTKNVVFSVTKPVEGLCVGEALCKRNVFAMVGFTRCIVLPLGYGARTLPQHIVSGETRKNAIFVPANQGLATAMRVNK